MIHTFSRRRGMSGWRPPWSSTRPRTRRVSRSSLCCMWRISTMCRSIASSSRRMQSRASTTMSVRFSTISGRSLVWSVVRAMLQSCSRSLARSLNSLANWSRNSTVAALATSKPSTITRGWRPSPRYCSACFMSSPVKSTVEVVPSPTVSSVAVAARAMRVAVGCWICISWRRVLPSLVSLIWPAPPTSILSVPFGPRLLRSTA
mmetsp:Transcript_4943/g.12641  ORF Transcript_4943/g.12641 Transcript_4943/m.12641 type:complete len:204 (-) Transcript_4943:210-821(-)